MPAVSGCGGAVEVVTAEERVVCVARRFWPGADRSLRLMI